MSIETNWKGPYSCTLINDETITIVRQYRNPKMVSVYVVDGSYASTQHPGRCVHDVVKELGGEAFVPPSFKVGDGITLGYYSDSDAWTVTKVSASGKTLTIQRDTATLLNGPQSGETDALGVTPGGFAAHISGAQRYEYERNPEGKVGKVRLTSNLVWKPSINTGAQRAYPGRNKYYDYNF